jgi:hypothetical protein
MRRSLVLVFLVGAVTAPLSAWAAQPADVALVTVLHGLPGFTADVYVNGELTLDGFQPLAATDPLELPAGEYEIQIRDVGSAPDSAPALEGTATVEAGQNLSIIAGLTEDGDPQLNLFSNDISPVAAGKTRLVIRHVAATGELDVRLDGADLITGLGNGDDLTRRVAAGSHSVEFVSAGTDDVLIGPVDLNLGEGTEQILFAVGSADQESLDVMTQTISDLASTPVDVGAGDAGLAARDGGSAGPVILVVAAAMMMAASGGWLVRDRRRRRSSLEA